MKLWLISQKINNGYDTWDSAVVAAETIEEARKINPNGQYYDNAEDEWRYRGWAKPEDVAAVEIGIVAEGYIIPNDRIVCSSFNAG